MTKIIPFLQEDAFGPDTKREVSAGNYNRGVCS
jgi:hypothetical protein